MLRRLYVIKAVLLLLYVVFFRVFSSNSYLLAWREAHEALDNMQFRHSQYSPSQSNSYCHFATATIIISFFFALVFRCRCRCWCCCCWCVCCYSRILFLLYVLFRRFVSFLNCIFLNIVFRFWFSCSFLKRNVWTFFSFTFLPF